MNTEVLRLVFPKKCHELFLQDRVRFDDRSFSEFRNLQVECGSLGFANASSQVAIGNTKVLCGIKSELISTKPGEGILDHVAVKVTFPFTNTQSLRHNQTLDQSQVANFVMQNFIESTDILRVDDLTDCKGKAFWLLTCEIICQEDDGVLYDACALGLVAALNNVRLPKVTCHEESGEFQLHENDKRPLKIWSQPFMLTFSTWNRTTLLVDPTKNEEELGEGTITVTYEATSDCFNLLRTSGCSLDAEMMDRCYSEAKKRSGRIMEVLRPKPSL